MAAVKAFSSPGWEAAAAAFKEQYGALQTLYTPAREHTRIPIILLDGRKVRLSPGRHNEGQRATVMEFAPRFAKGARLLYMGDTAHKNLIVNAQRLAALGIPITDHAKLPDVVLHQEEKN